MFRPRPYSWRIQSQCFPYSMPISNIWSNGCQQISQATIPPRTETLDLLVESYLGRSLRSQLLRCVPLTAYLRGQWRGLCNRTVVISRELRFSFAHQLWLTETAIYVPDPYTLQLIDLFCLAIDFLKRWWGQKIRILCKWGCYITNVIDCGGDHWPIKILQGCP